VKNSNASESDNFGTILLIKVSAGYPVNNIQWIIITVDHNCGSLPDHDYGPKSDIIGKNQKSEDKIPNLTVSSVNSVNQVVIKR